MDRQRKKRGGGINGKTLTLWAGLAPPPPPAQKEKDLKGGGGGQKSQMVLQEFQAKVWESFNGLFFPWRKKLTTTTRRRRKSIFWGGGSPAGDTEAT